MLTGIGLITEREYSQTNMFENPYIMSINLGPPEIRNLLAFRVYLSKDRRSQM